MVALKLKIEDAFFQPEERDGYLVSAEMKRIWAIELDILNEFARVCNENHLKWFAHAGTMLGAVRHHGFIPWDDDIDVVMPREDYSKLYQIGPNAFRAPYFFQNDETDPFFCRNFTRLRNSDTTAIQLVEKGYSFPFNQGVFIDIFPYDNVSDNEDYMKSDFRLMESFANSSWQYRNLVHFYRPKTGKGIKKRISYYIKHLWYKYINKAGGDYHRYLQAHLSLALKYQGENTKRAGEIIIPPLGRHIWDKKWLEKTVYMPFEMIQVPVPSNYEACLTASYGKDWRFPTQVGNYHGQVFFDVDHPYTDYINI